MPIDFEVAFNLYMLTRHGKCEGMVDSARKTCVDSARKNLKGWLTRHGKFEGMVDSARKNLKGWLTRHGKNLKGWLTRHGKT